MYEHPLVVGTVVAIALAGAALARVGRRVVLMLWFAVPFGLLIAVVNPLVVREGLTVIWRFGEIPALGQVDITLEAVVFGALVGARAVALLLASSLQIGRAHV